MTVLPWEVQGSQFSQQDVDDYFPTWLVPYLAPKPPHQLRLMWNGSSYGLHFSDSDYFAPSDTLEAAYDNAATRNKLTHEFFLDPSLLTSPDAQQGKFTAFFDEEDGQARDSLGMCSIPSSNPGYSRAINDDRWATDINVVASGFREAHEAEREWLDNKGDTLKAFRFVNIHPMFWSYMAKSDGSRGGFWHTDGGMALASTEMWFDEEKGVNLVAIETGPHQDANDYAFGERYLQMELTAIARTWEKAVRSLARNIYAHYDACGNERPMKIKVPDSSAEADTTCHFHTARID